MADGGCVCSLGDIKFVFILAIAITAILTLDILVMSGPKVYDSPVDPPPYQLYYTPLNQTLKSVLPGVVFTFDANLIASYRHSTIEILGGRRVYSTGDKVKVTITLYDQLGRRKTTGGDILRLWLAEVKVKANVAGDVIDNQDGTYTGSVLLPWRGRPTVYVSISVPHEMKRLISKTIALNNGSFLAFEGKFVGENSMQTTPCGPLFPKADRNNLCNFTEESAGLEWYCIAPTNQNLTCDDWQYIKCAHIKSASSESEKDFLREYRDRTLKESWQLNVDRGDAVMATGDTPCDQRPRQETWNTRPSGFYYNQTWNINGCRRGSTLQDDVTFRKYGRCLRNRHLILIGDSNVRSFVIRFVADLNMTLVRGKLGSLSAFTFAVNVNRNISLSFFPHYLPYYHPSFMSRHTFVPTTKRLDDIPAGNNSIIMLHLWLHSQIMDTRVFRSHVRQIRISAERMLQRAPNVDLIIKGPHASKTQIPPTDNAIEQHKRIWREEFQGIHDKVIFLDMWDITVGRENRPTHPLFVIDMIFIFLLHLCSIL